MPVISGTVCWSHQTFDGSVFMPVSRSQASPRDKSFTLSPWDGRVEPSFPPTYSSSTRLLLLLITGTLPFRASAQLLPIDVSAASTFARAKRNYRGFSTGFFGYVTSDTLQPSFKSMCLLLVASSSAAHTGTSRFLVGKYGRIREAVTAFTTVCLVAMQTRGFSIDPFYITSKPAGTVT